MSKYKPGDIVELMSIDIDRGNEGYYLNQYDHIPKVGNRYRVKSAHAIGVMVYTESRDMCLSEHQIFLYHRPIKDERS